MQLLPQLKHITLLTGFLIFCSCTDITKPSDDNFDSLTYVEDIEPIFRSQCIRCHGLDDVKQRGVDLTDSKIILILKNIIALKIDNNGSMYQYLNSANEANKIRYWLQYGVDLE